MKPFRILILFFVLLVVLISIYLPSRLEKKERIIERTTFAMGSTVQIKVSMWRGGDEKALSGAIQKAFEEIHMLEGLFTTFKEDSEVSRINNLKAGEALKVSDETFNLLEKSIEYHRKTSGAFDITVKPLVDLWRLAGETKTLPTDGQIKDALAKIGSQNIILYREEKTISFKKEGVKIDFGGIAQGYAADRAVKILKDAGIQDAIVNSSGDMYCLGRRSKKAMWNVGIQHPRKKDALFSEVELEDKAIDTSGDYEKYFVLDGKRYSHIIDPRTGYPIGDRVVSATVIANDSVTADALATALCILEPNEGLRMISSMDGVDAIIVFKDGEKLKTKMSEGLRRRYEIIEKKNL